MYPQTPLDKFHHSDEHTYTEFWLKYRFRPHFHPYVEALIDKLLKGSVDGLQDADTEYHEGQLRARPGTTRVRMEDGLSLFLDDRTPLRVLDTGEPTEAGTTRLLELGIGTEIIIVREHFEGSLPDGTTYQYGRNPGATLIGIEPQRALFDGDFFEENYQPSDLLVQEPRPVKEIDFASDGAYAVYNWELFYHVPLTFAIHLSKNHRFEDAQRWFHYIFDPTDDSDGPTPERFWKVKPFQYREVALIERVLESLHTDADAQLRQITEQCIDEWAAHPFRPHLVARFRQTPYMFKALMAYLDNLIAWGDSLFRQDTRESINEAMQIYVLAAKILGSRPQAVPKKGSIRPRTYHNLKQDLKRLGNAPVDLEAELGLDLTAISQVCTDRAAYLALSSIAHALYFCVPRNDKLIGYWDTVADRLFKIRNSLNIRGIFRQLPLFQPPIDPALLAKAAAAGLDVGAVVSGLNQPLPLVRFRLLVQKALEICQEVKSLGNGLLAAIEKQDNEALGLLRASHEQALLDLAKTLKYGQWQEAIKVREGLEKSLAATVERIQYYARLMDKSEEDIRALLKLPPESEIAAFGPDALDEENMAGGNYRQGEPAAIEVEPIQVNNAGKGISEHLAEGRIVSGYEVNELLNLEAARDWEKKANRRDRIASLLTLIPQFDVSLKPMGVGAGTVFGGVQLSKIVAYAASYARSEAAAYSYDATRSAKIGAYERREQEWAYQINLAAGEINQTVKQLRAAQIREFVARRDYENHQKQIALAADVQDFLKGEEKNIGGKNHRKTTTQAFYAWMRREVKGLYGEFFQFAFDIAKKAERALQQEFGDPSASFLSTGYLTGKQGLLAGEKLLLDIKRMEMAYHELNQREYELTKHASLQQINPLALMELRATGKCTVDLSETLFDMDCPGHYFRRIKTVAVSIPCVTGPFTSVNCTLTLLKSSIRKTSNLLSGEYERQESDHRFSDYFGSMQSIVTSSGKNDSGLFETSLQDERLLPFEGSGVISTWQLQLPANPAEGQRCQFDYDTISDVILHLRYTAREGGGLLRSGALTHVERAFASARGAGSVRLLSVRHELPTAWAAFKSAEVTEDRYPLTLPLRLEHFPLWCQTDSDKIIQLEVLGKDPGEEDADSTGPWLGIEQPDDVIIPDLPNSIQSVIDGNGISLNFKKNSWSDLWVLVTWGRPA